MRIASRGMAITFAALSLTGSAVAAPVETVLYSFNGGSDGVGPLAGLIADKQGALYGTTLGGGGGGGSGNRNCANPAAPCGTVFKLTPPTKGQTAWTELVLHRFDNSAGIINDGGDPRAAGLITDEQGALYGTTGAGGTDDAGTVFKLTPPAKGQTGWTETLLHIFTGSDGFAPQAGLLADKQGALYGTTGAGGNACPQNTNGCGIVFKLTPPAKGQTGWTETLLYRFCSQPSCSDGFAPVAGLLADKQGALYGTTLGGGSGGCPGGEDCGTVFKLTPPANGRTAWTEVVLYRFKGGSDGAFPYAGLIADEQGALYGTTVFGGRACPQTNPDLTTNDCGTVFKLTPPAKGQTAWTETVLYNFKGGSDGSGPYSGLIADKQGALYGTTVFGGGACPQPNPDLTNNCGTVFKVTPPGKGQTAWTEVVLYRFKGGSDGALPYAGLIADKEGALYGTTLGGGSSGFGTVFKMTP